MKMKFHVFFLFSLIFTLAMVANARQVSLQTNSGTDEKYVNMPVTGSDTLILGSETSFKVYDDGLNTEDPGNYSNNADGYLTLIAPEGQFLLVQGQISTESGWDYFSIHNGGPDDGYLLESVSGLYDLAPRAGSSNVITLHFTSDGGGTSSGLDLTVGYPDPAEQHSLEVLEADNGSLASDKASAAIGETVTLTAIPNTGYLLWNIGAVDEYGINIDVNGGKWYSGNTATLTMPYADVSVTPEFVNKENVEDYLFISLPKNGSLTATIPDVVDSFRVYSDGGEYGYASENADGRIVLKASEGHVLLVNGYVDLGSECGEMIIYDGAESDGKKLVDVKNDYSSFNSVASSANEMTIHFSTGSCYSSNMQLMVKNIDLSLAHAVQVGESDYGTLNSDKGTATFHETVTMTAEPQSGYLLWNVNVEDEFGSNVDVNGGKWYSNNKATFEMPYADVSVTSEFVNKKTAEEGVYINMPKEGTIAATIPAIVKSFKIYDDGGADENSSPFVDGVIEFTAAEGRILVVTGDAFFDGTCGELKIYDGTENEGTVLWNKKNESFLGTVVSSGNKIALRFKSGDCYAYSNLDLTIAVYDLSMPHSVMVIKTDGGTISSNKGSAKYGETVSLTATPDAGNVFGGLTVVNSYNERQKVFFDGNVATFSMPFTDVTVTPAFTNQENGMFVNLPFSGTKLASIPDGTNYFSVYDDGGNDNYYSNESNGTLVLTVPDEHVMRISGSIDLDREGDFFVIRDGGADGDIIFDSRDESISSFDNVLSLGSTVAIHFESDLLDNRAGLGLYVEVIDVSEPHAITVSDVEGGSAVSDQEEAKYATPVTITATPDEGYFLWTADVMDAESWIAPSFNGNEMSFRMGLSDVTVEPIFMDKKSAEEGLYVNMPRKGTKTVTVPNDVSSFKIYDDGGADERTSSYVDGLLVLTAPEGKLLQITGGILSQGCDSLRIYDGIGKKESTLLARARYEDRDIGAVVSSGRSMTLQYGSSSCWGESDGLDLLARLVNANTLYSITVGSADGGTVNADKATSTVGQTIVLTTTPNQEYFIDSILVTDDAGRTVAVQGGNWFDNQNASFRMPASDVLVSPAFADKDHLHINMPTEGTIFATIPSGITHFKVYDDGGVDGPYTGYSEGKLILTAPEGKVLYVSGSMTKENGYGESGLFIYDGAGEENQLYANTTSSDQTEFGPYVSSSNVMTISFKAPWNDDYAGLDLDIVVGEPAVENPITITDVTGGFVETEYTSAIVGKYVCFNAYQQNDDYMLDSVLVTDGLGNIVETEGGRWYLGSSFCFTMPNTGVSVVPAWTKARSAEEGLYINLPRSGSFSAYIPSDVKSFKVYDDGGSVGNYSDGATGRLEIMAPSNHVLQVKGLVNTESGKDSVMLYDGTYDWESGLRESGNIAKVGPFTSYGECLSIALLSDETTNASGVDLTVTVHDAKIKHNITVAEAVGGVVSSDKDRASYNEDVNLTIALDNDYVLDTILIEDADGNPIKLEKGGRWSTGTGAYFFMPVNDVTVTPVFSKKHTVADGLFINLDKRNFRVDTIPESVVSFKIFDNGGKDGDYEASDDGLVLTAPAGSIMQVSGSINTASCTYVSIYDGDGYDDYKLLWNESGEVENIDLTSTDRFLAIYVRGSSSFCDETGQGFDLTVTVLGTAEHAVNIQTVAGGTIESDKATARLSETVTLTAVPADNYLLGELAVVGSENSAVRFTGGSWALGNTATFLMPGSDVTVTPTWVSEWTAEGGLYVNMPKPGEELSVTIPEGVQSFKVYDDGGRDGDASYGYYSDATLKLTAPEGYVLRLSGTASILGYYSHIYANDGEGQSLLRRYGWDVEDENDFDVVFEPKLGKDNKVTINFRADYSEGENFDLTVELIPQNVKIVQGDGGYMEVDNVSATEGQEVTLTTELYGDYLFDHIDIEGADGTPIPVEGGHWYSDTVTKFTMPNQKVIVNPSYKSRYYSELYINMPKSGTIDAKIRPYVTSFKIYDDGGSDGVYSNSANGTIKMTLPEGYIFEVQGSMETETGKDVLKIYDGDENGDELTNKSGNFANIGLYASSGNMMTLSFTSDGETNFAGLDLEVTVKKAVKITRYAAVTIEETVDETVAIIDGYYSGKDTVEIKEGFDVDNVVINREFSTDGYATITLPFDINGDKVYGWSEVLEFYEMGTGEDGNLQVEMQRAWCDTCESLEGQLKANTPYIVKMKSNTLSVSGPVTLVPTEDPVVTRGNWEFRGAYAYKKWLKGDAELGRTYGFSGEQIGNIEIGQFVKAGAGASIYPMRAYLVNVGDAPAPTQFANSLNPNGSPVRKSLDSDLPETIPIVIVERDEDGEEHTTVIGHIKTRTGVLHMENAIRTYDLKGRRVNARPSKKGMFIRR